MTHLDKVLSIVSRLKVCKVAALASMLIVIGCFGPSSTGRPEVELVDLREGALMQAKVRRDGGKVWIEGVEGWNFAQRGSSVHAAMGTVMRAVGEDVPYEYLLGTSALAFRMQVHNEWCPSSPHSFCGYQCVKGSVNALPWQVRAYEVKPDNAEGVREARAAVVASIDRGVPCAYGSEEDGVIHGYQKGGEEWLCVHPFRGGKQFVETKWPWGIGVYTGRKAEMPDRRALVVASLKQAVEMAHTKNVDEYDCGFHAWEQWIARLRDEQWIAQRFENEAGLMQGNSWIYCCLVEYRAAAAKYLRSVAGDLDDEAADHLRKAADLYEKMVQDVLLAGDCPLDIAPMAENLKEGERWTQAMRTEQARRLEAALYLERQAIAEIEKALAAIKEAEMKTKVKREGGKVWIDYAADIDESCLSGLSHICRIADVLRYYGEDVDIDWLMGVSGEAFAYYYHPDGTYLTPFVHSWDSALAALEGHGYSGEWKEAGRGTGVEPSLRRLESEIEAGRVVIAPGIKASRNGINSRCHWWFVVNGVDVEAQEVSLLGKDERAANFAPVPKGDSADPREHPRWYGILRKGKGHYGDNPLLLVRRAAGQPDRRALALGVMERAVRTAREEPVRLSKWGGGEYLAGLAALERLLSDVEAAKGDGVEEFKRLNPTKGDPFGGVDEELLHLRLLSERRRAAAAFLRRAAVHLPEAARSHTNAAAAKYDEVSRLALEAFVLRHGPVEENDRIGEMGRLETYDDNPEWDAYWRRADENLADANKRKELARLIAGALDAERAAVGEIEKALAAEGVDAEDPDSAAQQSDRAPAYRAADRIRDDMRNLFNWGSGVYDTPGITPEDEKMWAGIFDLPAEKRLAAFAAQAEGHGCTQATVDEAVLWLNSDQKIEAMFYLVDQRDLRGFRRFLSLLHDTGSPLSFIIIRCEKIYDVLSLQPDWYIRHNNQFEAAKPEARPPDPEVRKDLLNINWDQAWDDPAALYASPFRAIVEAHERLSDTYGCTQKVEGDRILWSNYEGDLEAMFVVCDDTDLDGLRRIYRAIEEKDCPLTWLFLRLSHWQVPVFDILSLSRNHYMAHRNRIGDWH